MRDVSFEKAPLIEIVAELRWVPAGRPAEEGVGVNPADPKLDLGGPASHDEFFLRFAGEAAKAGFTQAEKLVPAGFPYVLHTVVWRFRKPGDPSLLLQVGAGVFSANGLQPYRRWKEFRPVVELGVKSLLATRGAEEKERAFAGLSLRYINGFSKELMGGRSEADFMRDVLGLKLELPKPIAALVGKSTVDSSVNAVTPIEETKKQLRMTIGNGRVKNEAAVVADFMVTETEAVAPTAEAVMAALDGSRDIIHDAFLEMTKGIQDAMEPRKENGRGA